MLRRETAVELPITPSKSAGVAGTSSSVEVDSGGVSNINERPDHASPVFNRNLSGDGRSTTSAQNYLIPSTSEPGQMRFRKSIESLPKNSSSDTDYSLQPYRVIKQSSNDTNTSLTGSFNIDQSFGAHELSLDTNETSAHYTTVVENIDQGSSSDTASLNRSSNVIETQPKVLRQMSDGGGGSGARSLRKQFSIDHPSKLDCNSGATAIKTNLKLPTISTIPATPTKTLPAFDSSTSTDESKDERDIPTISTNVVQDEIAKLSSNIKRSADDEKSTEPPLNETMC